MKTTSWLNRTVVGVGIASFLSDVSHETATSLLPVLAAGVGGSAALLGAVEGFSDAASGAAKLWGGWLADRVSRRKPLAVAGYLVSAVCGALLGGVTRSWEMIAARGVAWAGRGIRTAPRNALLAADVPATHFGRAFGFERALDTLGAVAGPLAAAVLVTAIPFRVLLWWTIVPGLLAAAAMGLLVRETPETRSGRRPFLVSLATLPAPCHRYLAAVALYGAGDFAHSMLILRAMEILSPHVGSAAATATAITLYGLHNIVGALMAWTFGAAGDRFGRLRMLSWAWLIGPVMAILLALPVAGSPGAAAATIAIVFVLAGTLRAGESALESAVAAEMLPAGQRGMGFGALAFVNSAGDLISSVAVGAIWQAAGPSAAFLVALVPMTAGWLVIVRMAREGRAASHPSRSR